MKIDSFGHSDGAARSQGGDGPAPAGAGPSNVGWESLAAVEYADMAAYIHRHAAGEVEKYEALLRLRQRLASDEAFRALAPRGELLAFHAFRRLGVMDCYQQVASPEALKAFVQRQPWQAMEQEVGGATVGQAMLLYMAVLLDDEIARLAEGLQLLGRLPKAPADGKAARQALPHFALEASAMALDIACRGLVNGGYLLPGTSESAFRYICTGQGRSPQQALVWTGKKNEFKLLVTTLFAGQPRMWETATACFVHASGPFGNHVRNAHLPLADDSERLLKAIGRRNRTDG